MVFIINSCIFLLFLFFGVMRVLNIIVFYTVLLFGVGFFIHQGMEIYVMYVRHDILWKKAEAYLKSDVCSSKMRHQLDNYNLCDKSEEVLSLSPLTRAFFEELSKWHLCAEDRCTVLYYDITQHLYQIVVLAIVTLVVIMYFWKMVLALNQHRDMINYYALPGRRR